MSWTSFISYRTQTAVRRFFAKLGVLIYKHPFIFLICGTLLSCLSGIGILWLNFESRGLYLWSPQESQVWQEYQQSIDYFGEIESYAFLLIKHSNGENLLTPKYLNLTFEMYLKFFDENVISVKEEGESFGFSDLCQRKYPGYPNCMTLEEDNIYAIFGNNPSNWQSQAMIEDTLSQSSGATSVS